MLSKFCILVVVLAVFTFGASGHTQVSSVSGIVIDSVTHRPINGAALRIASLSASSDRDGHFNFQGLPTGAYRLTAVKQGYVEARGLPINIDSVSSLDSIVYEMVPSGVIVGRVVDDEGRPMRGIIVQAWSHRAPRGNSSTTNDRGEFRVFSLDPGDYTIAALPYGPETLIGGRVGYFPSNPDAAYVVTYYPGTARPEEAETVRVESREIDVHAIQMAALSTRHIQVRIVNVELHEGLPFGLRVFVDSVSNVAPIRLLDRLLPPAQEFSFDLGIDSGAYRLSLAASKLSGERYFGSVAFDVGRSDPDIIIVPLTHAVSVQGRVQADAISKGLSVTLDSDTYPPLSERSTTLVNAQGGFKFEDVFPGRYVVRINGLADNAYLSSSASIEVPQMESSEFTLMVSNDGGQIHGRANLDSTVVLVPGPSQRARLDLYRTAIPDGAGDFEMHGIAPGRYTIFAVGQIDRGGYQDQAYLQRFEDLGMVVSIPSHADMRVDPPYIPK